MLLVNILSCLFLATFAQKLKNFPPKYQDELDSYYWESLARAEIFQGYNRKNIHRKAKNVILFVGGGMGLSTITASRILKGQLKQQSGEETKLNFENFPNTCLLKTYTVDQQVPDSSGTATALISGVKTNNGVTGVTARVKKGESSCETVQKNIVISVFDLAFDAGKNTGIVTTNRLTEGSVAGAYASIASEDWEGKIPPKFAHHPTNEDCKDKARQLVENHPGKNFNVILGGGGRYLYPKNYTDPVTGRSGQRDDGIDLVEKWQELKRGTGLTPAQYKFVRQRDELLKIRDDQGQLKHLFGVFNEDHMNFERERTHLEPDLTEMVEAAINVLKTNPNGFLLLVENGQIDLAHHENRANLAMSETLQLDAAVEKALKMVSVEDTLIVVTADHSQALTINGEQPRGNSIFGVAGVDDEKRKSFTTLLYTNGPGYRRNRTDPKTVDTSNTSYQYHSGIFVESSHHTGEDVALYSIGPMSHLFHGTKEQSYVAHAMELAACIGPYVHYDHCTKSFEPSKVEDKAKVTVTQTGTQTVTQSSGKSSASSISNMLASIFLVFNVSILFIRLFVLAY